jgi:hypothetical protein
MKRTWLFFTIIGFLILFLGVNAPEISPGEPAKPEFSLKLMGINRTLDPWKLYEEWAQSVEKRTNGRLPWADAKRYVQPLRGLLRGDTVEVDGALCRLLPSAGYMPPFPIEVPIVLAAQGPLGRQVAQDVADGVIMPSRFVTGGFDPCVVTAFGTVLDEVEDVDSPRVRAAAGAGVARAYHTTYEARGDAVDALPNGRAWRESLERIPEETRHLARHFGHGIEMNEHDRAHGPMTDAKRLTFTGTPSELRVRLADLEARALTRTPESDTARHFAALPGVTVVRGNYGDVRALEAAAEGADRAYVACNNVA